MKIYLALLATMAHCQLISVDNSSPNNCTSVQYFDTTMLRCNNCPDDAEPSDDSKFKVFHLPLFRILVQMSKRI